ncbi:hypothetical protein FHS49_003811 [Sphingobium boeckii]|uniref:Uncharacterized protein n=1 Tax=Sphingobium boeckii TaxID=1082345 RepID=A0A7W9ALA7_9SPHN|nr:hypothetical protein [Sphingobium boeckii]
MASALYRLHSDLSFEDIDEPSRDPDQLPLI